MSKRERFKLSASVFVFLFKDDKVLLIKRSNTGWMDGFYSVPAGALDGSETLKNAAIREANEETGVLINPKDITLSHVSHNFTHGDEWLGAYFTTSRWEGEPIVKEPEKHAELIWAEINDLPENIIPYVKIALQQAMNHNSYSDYSN